MSKDEVNPNPDLDSDHCIPCLKTAKIIVQETQSTYHCVIRNLCFVSVKLEIQHYIELPDRFLLSMNSLDYAAPIACKIQSRIGNDVIVRFV